MCVRDAQKFEGSTAPRTVFFVLGGIGLCRCYGRVKTENKRAKVGGVMKVRAEPPPPTHVLTKVLNGLTRTKSRTPQRLLQSRWVAASHGAKYVVEGKVQNVKRSTILPTYRPRHCSHNPPRAPTAPTHPKPTRTHHIYQKRVDPATTSNHRFGALEQPLWDLL